MTGMTLGEAPLDRGGGMRYDLLALLARRLVLLVFMVGNFLLPGCASVARKHYDWGLSLLAQGEEWEMEGYYSYLSNELWRGNLFYMRDEKFKSAESEFRKALLNKPGWVEAQEKLSRLLKPQEADSISREIIRLHPHTAEAHFAQGHFFYHNLDYEKAISEYQKAISMKPSNALYHVAFARALMNINRDFEAEQENRIALRLNPNLCAAYENLKRTLNKQGKYSDEETLLREEIKNRPNSDIVIRSFAECLDAQGKHKEAAKWYGRVLEIYDDAEKRYYSFLDSSEKYSNEMLLRETLKKDPEYFLMNFQMAECLDSQGKRKEARVFWEKLLKMLGGENAEIKQRLAEPEIGAGVSGAEVDSVSKYRRIIKCVDSKAPR